MIYMPNVRPTELPRRWVTTEAFRCIEGLTVPEGFIFDGASIPVGLRWIFPHGGSTFGPACAHDYCYRTHCKTKEEADNLFLSMMEINEVPVWRRKVMYWGVRLFGAKAWGDSYSE